jgi:hypothetical protein
MARRPSRQQDDNQDDELFNDAGESLFDDGSARLYDDDDDEPAPPKASDKKGKGTKAREPRPKRTSEPASGIVRVIGGFFQVLSTIIIAVPVFVVLGVAITLGGRAAGVLPTPPVPTLASRIEVASAPTAAPDSAALDPNTEAVGTPVPTTDPGCAQAQSWWDSQRDNYQYFVERFGSRYTLVPVAELQPVLDEMTRRRAATTASTNEPCLTEARDGLVAGMGTVIAAYTLLNAGDSSSLETYRNNAETAFTTALTGLWEDWDVATDTDAPSVINIPRLGGESCSAVAWYDSIREQINGFNAIIDAVDPRTVSPGRLRQDVDNMTAIRTGLSSLETPPCAVPARDAIVAMMDSYIQGYEAIGNVDEAATDAAFARASAQSYEVHAWLTWLGVAA